MPSYKHIFTFGALSVFQGVTIVNAFVTPLRSNNRQSSLFVIDFLKGIIPGGGNGGSAGVESFLATEECDVCIVGGGVAGMASALTLLSAESGSSKKVTLVEASPTLGGRVQSDVTEDGYILDRGTCSSVKNVDDNGVGLFLYFVSLIMYITVFRQDLLFSLKSTHLRKNCLITMA